MAGIRLGWTVGRARVLAATGVAALALAAAACNGSQSPTAMSPPPGAAGDGGSGKVATASPLLGNWKLVSLQQADGLAQPVPTGTLFSADFRGDGLVSAVVDCNRCSGGYTAGADTLAVSPMACTRAYCVASAPFDSHYETLLGSASGWRVAGATLELRSDRGVLKFER